MKSGGNLENRSSYSELLKNTESDHVRIFLIVVFFAKSLPIDFRITDRKVCEESNSEIFILRVSEWGLLVSANT